jgi:hypothetical protein
MGAGEATGEGEEQDAAEGRGGHHLADHERVGAAALELRWDEAHGHRRDRPEGGGHREAEDAAVAPADEAQGRGHGDPPGVRPKRSPIAATQAASSREPSTTMSGTGASPGRSSRQPPVSR